MASLIDQIVSNQYLQLATIISALIFLYQYTYSSIAASFVSFSDALKNGLRAAELRQQVRSARLVRKDIRSRNGVRIAMFNELNRVILSVTVVVISVIGLTSVTRSMEIKVLETRFIADTVKDPVEIWMTGAFFLLASFAGLFGTAGIIMAFGRQSRYIFWLKRLGDNPSRFPHRSC